MPSPHSTDGKELFIQYRCVRCHTIGRGSFVGPDLAGVGDRYAGAEILRWIENPKLIYSATGKMPVNPGYPPMPPMEVPPRAAEAIANYITSVKVTGDPSSGGTITGQVVNGSDGTPRAGVEVTLTPFMGDNADDESIIKSDSEGSFSFDGLSWDRSYTILITYKGAEYSTDKMVFNPGESSKTLSLPVYEPTYGDENIKIEEAHLILQVVDGNVSVADLSVFNNTGDTVYVGGKELSDGRKESVRFSVPDAALNINFIHGLDPGSVVTTEDGFSDTASIVPGPKRAVFTYTLPLGSGKAVLDKQINYPTSSFLLLVSDTGEEYRVKGLQRQKPVVIQNETFLKWTGSNLLPGHEVVINVKSDFTVDKSYMKWGALGFFVLIVLAGIIYSAVSGAKKEGEGLASEEAGHGRRAAGEADLRERRSALIREVAALDDGYEAGDIGGNKYTVLREEKKKEILELTRRLRLNHKSP